MPIFSGVRVIRDYLSLIRAVNCAVASAGVWVGAYLASPGLPVAPVLLTSVAVFLVCAAGNMLNDVVDLAIDRINRPRRTLVRGAVSVPRAKLLVVAFNTLAIVVSLLVSWQVLIVVTLSAIALFVYNIRLKGVPLVGNFVVAILGGLTFVVGGMAVDPRLLSVLPGPAVPAIFAVLFHLVREIIKDVEDVEGDRRADVKTIPQFVGPVAALTIAIGLFVVLVLLTLVPIYYDWFSRAYEILTVYVIDLPLLALLIVVWGNPTKRLLRVGSMALKTGMIVGLFAMVLGR